MYYGQSEPNSELIRGQKIYEDLFTNKDYSIPGYPELFMKEGNHRIVIKIQNEEDEENHHSFNINTTLVKNADGTVSVVITCEDEDNSEGVREDLKRRLSYLENLSVIGELAASAVHEIKNPLFSIRGFLQIIDNSFSDDDKRKEYIRIMISEIDRLEGLVRDFLMLAKTRARSKGSVIVCELIRDIAELYKNRMEMQNIKFSLMAEDESVCIPGNREQLEQVFINLIQNALEAMENGGNIEVVVYRKNEKLVIEVRDEGKGISPEIEKKIFTPFFTNKKNGTGLGLFLSKKIVEEHMGRIYFRSTEGKGTVFFLEFPLVKT
ncbi:two-component system sensor histidine kinase NtrB [Thermosediminibacter oceani]|uniref:histidine kinase n=1 Tax=Thermosediminibacter oceani (strain ATCC BAA-1034 / DSM 16646 / JW/IW-1228P) TaxID=555079 RepID=D9S060_THEOJ|nr:ATP-binding protein [Thermosediminibacter oceani]ADL06988.1 histidine kinase [Thermosediminibacter oceani DSM 16646]